PRGPHSPDAERLARCQPTRRCSPAGSGPSSRLLRRPQLRDPRRRRRPCRRRSRSPAHTHARSRTRPVHARRRPLECPGHRAHPALRSSLLPILKRRPIRPTRRSALALAAVAVIALALPVAVVVPVLLAAAVAGCLLTDWWVARRAHPTVERTPPATLALKVPSPFNVRIGELDEGRRGSVRQPYPPELRVKPATSQTAEIAGQLE